MLMFDMGPAVPAAPTGPCGPCNGNRGPRTSDKPKETGRLRRSRLSGAGATGHVPVPPALVNLVLTGCKPGFPARGFRTVTSQPDDIWLGCPAAPVASADTAGLAGFEQIVLGDMSRRLAGTGGAPLSRRGWNPRARVTPNQSRPPELRPPGHAAAAGHGVQAAGGVAAASAITSEAPASTRPAGIDRSPASSLASGSLLSAPVTSHMICPARARAG